MAADAVAAVAGTAQSVTDDQFAAGILFPAPVSVDTEVVGIIKASVVPCVSSTVVQTSLEMVDGSLQRYLAI